MGLPRIIPVLLMRNRGLIKTFRFKDHKYIGDPRNAVRIFNEKEVDELIILDVDASKNGREPDYDLLKEIVSECFSPIGYGGGVKNITQIKRLTQIGIEKIIINTATLNNSEFIKSAVENFGSSTIVGAMDVKKNFFGKYSVWSHVNSKITGIDPVTHALQMEQYGIGELFVNNVDLDGMMTGYDHHLMSKICNEVKIPVIACGGASDVDDLIKMINNTKASAAAAGSLFVFHGKHKAVLITYPSYQTITQKLQSQTK